MTAGAGPIVHSYKACYLNASLPVGTGCQAFAGQRDCWSGVPILEWRVARAGHDCPAEPTALAGFARAEDGDTGQGG